MNVGAQLQLGSGGDAIAQFGQELVYGSNVGAVKDVIEGRWRKSIGRSYCIQHVDEAGDLIEEIYKPRLVKIRSRVKVRNYVGQLEFAF